MKADISRRGLLCAAGAFAGCFVLGGGAVALGADDDHLRPPGGQDQARLRALCVKCDRCRTVCPHDIIVPVSTGEGLIDARTPCLNFHLGYCDFCGLCKQVCPTQALSPDFDPDADAIGVARLDTGLCLAYSSSCEKCKDSCRFGALTLDDLNRPAIDEALQPSAMFHTSSVSSAAM